MVVDLPNSGRAGDADPHSLAGVGQQCLHQIAGGGLMVGTAALDQRNGAGQRRAVAGAEFAGERLDVDGFAFAHC